MASPIIGVFVLLALIATGVYLFMKTTTSKQNRSSSSTFGDDGDDKNNRSSSDVQMTPVAVEARPSTQPAVVRQHMSEIAAEIRYLVEEAPSVAETVYTTWLESGGDENPCVFAETLEARLAPMIVCYARRAVEKRQALSVLVHRLVSYVIRMNPEHYSSSSSVLIQRISAQLEAPTDTNWIEAMTPSSSQPR